MAYQYQQYKPSSSVQSYKNKQDTATNTYSNYSNQGYSQGAGGLGSQVNSAQAKLNALYHGNTLTQQFKYGNQRQYDQALKNITDRKAFSYDLASDPLFQQAKEQYQSLGKTAMADTMGQAAAMTGGYGNSYAASAGNQAYQNYLTQLNNSVGDYYAMALSAYNNETDRLNGVFNALSTDRSAQQTEWSNNWNVYNNLYKLYQDEYSDMLGKDMTAWQQKGTNLYNAANLATSQYSTASSNDIDTWNKQENLKATQASQLETERHNRADEDYKNRSLAETIRSNMADEDYKNRSLAETTRSNKANEKINSARYNKTYKDANGELVSTNKKYSASAMIDKVDQYINNNLYAAPYYGDRQKVQMAAVNKIIRTYSDNGNITYDTYKKLAEYYHFA